MEMDLRKVWSDLSDERLCGGITQHQATMSNQDTTEGDCPPTNCSAFPDPCGAHPGSHPPNEQKGMTLRDYFAAKAMAAMLSQPEAAHDWTDEKVAEWAYNAADAMLIRRQNGKDHQP